MPEASPSRSRHTLCVLSACLTLSCAATPTPPPAPVETSATPGAPTLAPATLEPLTGEERALSLALRQDVERITALSCPPSPPEKPARCGRNLTLRWELAEVADWLSAQLTAMGYQVNHQGIEADGAIALNLDVTIPGGTLGEEFIVIGAYYDSSDDSPGADANASGAAGLLALARSLSGRRHQRTLSLAWYANRTQAEPGSSVHGSTVHARSLATSGYRVAAMLSLESIGYFRDEPGSQQPTSFSAAASRGDFIAVLGADPSRRLVTHATQTLTRHSSLPVAGGVVPAGRAVPGWSDAWSFEQLGYAAVQITDTAEQRNPHFRKATDTADTLDYDRMARVVSGVEALVVNLAGGPHL